MRMVPFTQTADEHTQIRISQEEEKAGPDGILYLDISLTGENGEIECNRDTKLRLRVEGGELLAFGSANPKTEEDFLSGEYTTYYGRSLAVVKVQKEPLYIEVSGEGLKTVSKVICAVK